MSDTVDFYRDWRELKRRVRARYGVPCPRCQVEQPKRDPTILLPGARCKVHRPAYVDPRARLTNKEMADVLCTTSQ